jgi:hypothetical protein
MTILLDGVQNVLPRRILAKKIPPVGAQGLRPEEIIGVAGNAIK